MSYWKKDVCEFLLFGFCLCLANVVLRMLVVKENYSYLNLYVWNYVRESVTLGKIPTIFFRVVRSEFFLLSDLMRVTEK